MSCVSFLLRISINCAWSVCFMRFWFLVESFCLMLISGLDICVFGSVAFFCDLPSVCVVLIGFLKMVANGVVVMEICRLSMSALFDHARVLVEIRRVIKHFLFVKTESENIWSIKQL